MPQWCIIHHFLTWILLFTPFTQFCGKCAVEHVDAGSASKQSSECWLNILPSTKCIFIYSFCEAEAGERSLSGGSPLLCSSSACIPLITCTSLFASHRLWIIQFSDFATRTVRESPVPHPYSSSHSSSFLSSARLSLPPACTVVTLAEGGGEESPASNHVYMFFILEASECKNWGWVDVVEKKSTQIISKQTIFSRNSAHKIRKEMNQFYAHLRTKQVCYCRQQKYQVQNGSLKYLQCSVPTINNPTCV